MQVYKRYFQYEYIVLSPTLLKALDTIGNYSKQLLAFNNFVYDQWRAVGSIKHCEKPLPLK